MVTDSQACVVRVHKFEWEKEKRSSKIWLSAIFANWASSWCLFSLNFFSGAVVDGAVYQTYSPAVLSKTQCRKQKSAFISFGNPHGCSEYS